MAVNDQKPPALPSPPAGLAPLLTRMSRLPKTTADYSAPGNAIDLPDCKKIYPAIFSALKKVFRIFPKKILTLKFSLKTITKNLQNIPPAFRKNPD